MKAVEKFQCFAIKLKLLCFKNPTSKTPEFQIDEVTQFSLISLFRVKTLHVWLPNHHSIFDSFFFFQRNAEKERKRDKDKNSHSRHTM